MADALNQLAYALYLEANYQMGRVTTTRRRWYSRYWEDLRFNFKLEVALS